jgi:uncharacterized protein YecE (DUF72 family)
MLEFYATHFSTVEINNTFYRLPDRRTLRAWREAVPRDFVFSIKASRYITHMKKLLDPASSTKKFFTSIRTLGARLGPVLFQLPPRWSFDEPRFADFLESLRPTFRYAFEFRDRSWLNDRALDLLSQHNAAFCIYDLEGFLTPLEVTADFVYVRLHGPRQAYRGSYDGRTLEDWAEKLARWSSQARRVYCYFDNDAAGHAVKNAARLRSLA